MTRRARLMLFLAGGCGLLVMIGLAVAGLPALGGAAHPYRDRAVPAAAQHATPNVVSAVNYDQRAFDTLGEETILLAAVSGAGALLRPAAGERTSRHATEHGRVASVTAFAGAVLLPVTLMVGINVIVHGHLTPGGGFQGGVVLGTGVHLVYLTGRYRALERLRPVPLAEAGEAAGTAAFVMLGIAGTLAGAGFLGGFLPTGTPGALVSAGTVPLLSCAIGIEVASGVVVLLAAFLDQALRVRPS